MNSLHTQWLPTERSKAPFGDGDVATLLPGLPRIG